MDRSPSSGCRLRPWPSSASALPQVEPVEIEVFHSTAPTAVPAVPDTPPPARRAIQSLLGTGDRMFHGVSWLGGLSVLAIMTLVGLFLTLRGVDALRATGFSFITTTEWEPDARHFGIAAVLTLTVLIAARRARRRRAAGGGHRAVHLRDCAAAAEADVHLDGRPHGRGAEHRLRTLGRVLPPRPRPRVCRAGSRRGSPGSRFSRSTAPIRTTRWPRKPCTPRRPSSPASSWP